MSRPVERWPALRAPSRRQTRPLVFLLLLPMLLGLFAATPAQQVHGDELDEAKTQQSQLKSQIENQKAQVAKLELLQSDLKSTIKDTQSELDSINADLTAVRRNIKQLEGQIKQAQEEYDDLVRHVETLDLILARLTAQAAEKEQELIRTKGQLADRIRAAYEADRTSVLETVLSGASFNDVLVEAGYQIEIGDENRALAEQITEQQEILQTVNATVADTKGQTETLRDETEARRIQLDADKAELEAARARLVELEKKTQRALGEQEANFKKLAASKDALNDQIAEAAAAEKKLEQKIQAILREIQEKQQNAGNIPSEFNGTLVWPLAGTVTQSFGCTGFAWEPPQGECAHWHSGIDIAAPMYTPIKAAGAGTVLFAGPNPYDAYPKAWIVIIAHSSNLLTWYGHVDDNTKPPAVRVGQQVNAGDVIAYVGMTGRTTGPHLHWMVQYNNDFVNPRLFT